MEILLVGPAVLPLGGSGYGGIERLCGLLAGGLGRRGHGVRVIGGRGSGLPKQEGVEVVEGSGIGSYDEAEGVGWEELGWMLRYVEVVLDMSHGHYFRRGREGRVPGVSFIWHDPAIMEPPLPVSCVCALSEWQAKRFREKTGRGVVVADPICADEGVYYRDGRAQRTERWLAIGVMEAQKGHLEAARLCRGMGVGLDIIGPRGPLAYEEAVKEAGGDGVKYHGEVSHEEKMGFLRSCAGLLYPVAYPAGMGEAHSHKLVEALMCGTPCMVLDQGAMREVFEGYAVVDSLAGMEICLAAWQRHQRQECPCQWWGEGEPLNPLPVLDGSRAKARWGVEAATGRVEGVLKRVLAGERW